MTETEWLQAEIPLERLHELWEHAQADRLPYFQQRLRLLTFALWSADEPPFGNDFRRIHEFLADNDDDRLPHWLVEEARQRWQSYTSLLDIRRGTPEAANWSRETGRDALFCYLVLRWDNLGEVFGLWYDWLHSLNGDGLLRASNFCRDVFANPFSPVNFEAHWRTSDTVALAQAIYDDRAFDRLPILADALMDAGCEDEQIIGHCRSEGPHVRGCWVVDLVLGKT